MKITTINKLEIDMENTTQSIKKSGNLNPMFGKRHSYETKNKISSAQKARYAAIRKALQEQDILNYADTDDKARKDVLKQLLDKNELNFKSVQQAVNFLGIMLQKDRIQHIVREEINNLLNDSFKVGNDNN